MSETPHGFGSREWLGDDPGFESEPNRPESVCKRADKIVVESDPTQDTWWLIVQRFHADTGREQDSYEIPEDVAHTLVDDWRLDHDQSTLDDVALEAEVETIVAKMRGGDS